MHSGRDRQEKSSGGGQADAEGAIRKFDEHAIVCYISNNKRVTEILRASGGRCWAGKAESAGRTVKQPETKIRTHNPDAKRLVRIQPPLLKMALNAPFFSR